MNYKLKIHTDKVTFLLKTGKDLVRNRMRADAAQHIINTGTVKESDIKGFPINVDDTWWFEGEPVSNIKKSKTKKTEEAE